MVIFHSYVSLPEGNSPFLSIFFKRIWGGEGATTALLQHPGRQWSSQEAAGHRGLRLGDLMTSHG